MARVLRGGYTAIEACVELPVDGWLTDPIKGVQFTGTLQPNQTNRWFTSMAAVGHVIWIVHASQAAKPGATERGCGP